jgi:hypothetical protein
MKRKMQWSFDSKVCLENDFQVMELLIFFGKEFFLIIAFPKQASISVNHHTTCVRVGACVGVHH